MKIERNMTAMVYETGVPQGFNLEQTQAWCAEADWVQFGPFVINFF